MLEGHEHSSWVRELLAGMRRFEREQASGVALLDRTTLVGESVGRLAIGLKASLISQFYMHPEPSWSKPCTTVLVL